jgi:hypothetical protein
VVVGVDFRLGVWRVLQIAGNAVARERFEIVQGFDWNVVVVEPQGTALEIGGCWVGPRGGVYLVVYHLLVLDCGFVDFSTVCDFGLKFFDYGFVEFLMKFDLDIVQKVVFEFFGFAAVKFVLVGVGQPVGQEI